LEKILADAAPLVSRKGVKDIIRFSDLDSAFHLEIVRMAGNATLTKGYTDAHFHMHNFGTQFASIRRRAGEAHAEHHEILRALKSGDAKRIEGSITHHLEMVRRNLMISAEK
jgi:DNA-binding GntR family transcriptional regulator